MNTDRIYILLARKLAGEATKAELFELNDLINLDKNVSIIKNINEDYWNLPIEQDNDYLEATYLLHNQKMKNLGIDLGESTIEPALKNTINTNKKIKLIAILSSCAILLFVMFFSVRFNSQNSKINPIENIVHSEVSTKMGSRSKVKLPDGTSVWLNSNSKITYDNKNFGDKLREVTLVGEAYFDVVKNALKPFVIHTSKMNIKVLGTAFNVKCYPDEKNIETSLIRGSIEVTLKDRQEKIILKPNEKLLVNNNETKEINNQPKTKIVQAEKEKSIIELRHITFLPLDSTVVETAWVTNKLVFSDESMENVALKMEKWYGISIEIKYQELKKVHLTGTFEKETINQALNALQFITPFNYKIEKNKVTIIK